MYVVCIFAQPSIYVCPTMLVADNSISSGAILSPTSPVITDYLIISSAARLTYGMHKTTKTEK